MEDKTPISAIAALGVSTAIAALSTFIGQVVLARALGPDTFGVIASAIVIASFVAPIVGAGLHNWLLWIYGNEGWAARRHLESASVVLILSTATGVVGMGAWALLGPHDKSSAIVISLFIPHMVLLGYAEIVSGKFQLEERYHLLSVWQSLPHFSRLLVIVFIAAFLPSSDVNAFAYAYGGTAMVFLAWAALELARLKSGAIALVGHAPVSEVRTVHGPTAKGVTAVIKKTIPFCAAGVFHLIYFQSAIVLLKYIKSDALAGFYGAAFTLVAAAYLIPGIYYYKFLLPRIHRWSVHDRHRLLTAHKSGVRAMALAGVCFGLTMVVLAPQLINVLFGEEYEASTRLLSILALCIPLRFVAICYGSLLLTGNHIRRKIRYMGVTGVVNVILNISLIHEYGAVGACIATVISEMLLLVLYWRGGRKHVVSQLIVSDRNDET